MPTHFRFEPGALVTNSQGILGRVFCPIDPRWSRAPVFETSDAIALASRVPNSDLGYVWVRVAEGQVVWHPGFCRRGQRWVDSSMQAWNPPEVLLRRQQPRNLRHDEIVPGTRVMHRFRPLVGVIESWRSGDGLVSVLVGDQHQQWWLWQTQACPEVTDET